MAKHQAHIFMPHVKSSEATLKHNKSMNWRWLLSLQEKILSATAPNASTKRKKQLTKQQTRQPSTEIKIRQRRLPDFSLRHRIRRNQTKGR
ncbi:hypothetical protein OPY85_000820 [Escherichia coli]|uniref:hypothetical protein n=1 Tax=Escherichia coli TaxID=562 RepID=UPI00145FAC54|nr:hypothetical protein [Escherichia coli]EFD8981230.1 hypothetical protein [Escherichia coli]EKC3976648.1 hypothetical protein [Escherichia coli]HBD8347964.1 hypothetical protein [Escherichia coli]